MEENIIINNNRKDYQSKISKSNSSFKKDSPNNNPKMTPNINLINGVQKFSNNKNKLTNDILFDCKIKEERSPNKNEFPIKIINNLGDSNNIGNDENDNDAQKGIEKNIYFGDTIYDGRKTKNVKSNFRNNSMKNSSKNMINSMFHNNLDNIIFSNNNNVMLIDKKTSFNSERLDITNVIKINKLKDEYIDFLQKQFHDKSNNNARLDINNKELLKKCDKLIIDNRLLNETLNDRTSKLNKITQENIYMKKEYNQSMASYSKMQQKIKLFEDQVNLLKTNNENYQKIIKELKEQNDKLNLNLKKIKNTHEETQKKVEEKYINEIEDIKKNMEELYDNKIKSDDENECKIKSLLEEIKLLKEKIEELIEELESKENIINLMYKDNEKLIKENKLNLIKIEQCSKQINELKTIIQKKENMINSFKSKANDDRLTLNKSNSISFMKFIDGNEILSENITKLINDNEENRMKIEVLNNRLKSIDDIKRKYNNLIKDNKEIPLNNKFQTDFIFSENLSKDKINSKRNNSYKNNSELRNIEKKNFDINNNDTSFNNKKRTFIPFTSINLNNQNNSYINKKDLLNKESDEYKVLFEKEKDLKSHDIKNIKTIEKEINKVKEIKSPDETIFVDSQNIIKERRGESENKKVLKNKIFEEEKNYNKKQINKNSELNKEKNLKRNFSQDPKSCIFPIDKKDKKLTNNIQKGKIVKNKNNENSYYLFGIDRNDFFHRFDINNKLWEEKKNILDIKLDDKSVTFKNDYQYEGTLLYNILEGVYILTGEKTDTLYYFDSKTNSISKICKFNHSHNNGSIMYDKKSNCIYVFGGKKITSCEYYSFSNKKIYELPDLISDRANSSFIISNNKIFGFFGFSYKKDTYVKSIEFIDYNKKDKWVELNNIKMIKNDIFLDVESVSTMYYKHNNNQILIYSGIQGENEDFITDYYLLYDTKNNTMDKIDKWNLNQYKYIGNDWRDYEIKINDPKGFHFAKNSNFILMPKNAIPEGYDDNDLIDILIDYKNNVHFIIQKNQQIDIYRGEL